MEYLKIFFFFYFFLSIALINGIPIPENNDIINNNDDNNELDIEKLISVSNNNEIELSSQDINDMSYEILDNVSDSLQNAFSEELNSDPSINTNEIINKTINDIVNKNSEKITKVIRKFFKDNIKFGNLEKLANEATSKIATVLDEKIIPSITSKIKIDENFENFTKNILDNAGKNIHNFIQNTLVKTKEFTDHLNIDSTSDISTILTNGIGYLIKKTLCKSLGNEISGICENISTTIIVNISEILNGIIRTSINTISGNSIYIACNSIHTNILNDLSHIIVNTITQQINITTHHDTEQAQKIANNIIDIINNTVENLLCGKAKYTDINIINKDPKDIATDLIDKFNDIGQEVIINLMNDNDNESENENENSNNNNNNNNYVINEKTLADEIVNDINKIQQTMENNIDLDNYIISNESEQLINDKIIETFNGESIINELEEETIKENIEKNVEEEENSMMTFDLNKSDINSSDINQPEIQQPIINFNAPINLYVILNKNK
ncbi:hypothetical protein BCR32DRAFT_283678 [Anaeromyces robustus]|uniref:Uncharacterized protein n=1 Tax=Anaeromyces robustus TaxID=1754192 RepID=A0A1Y1WTR1_9FUNG|nr:hypothetical protein BCR32DRAFT_283678 [Anaeromyces robustus]|eukprot:ORX76913.1 hypothetical protein BCR32DRAFT_283678 [Anaeromyces robustus]